MADTPEAPGQDTTQANPQGLASGVTAPPSLYMVQDSRTPSQRLWGRMNQLGSQGASFLPVLTQVTAPGAPVYIGNGKAANTAVLEYQAEAVGVMFPDLEIEIDRVIEAGDYLVLLIDMYGHPAPGNPIMLSNDRVKTKGAFLARADADGRIAELWVYVYPGGVFSFPARGRTGIPPGSIPGTAEQARRCYDVFTRHLAAGEPFEIALGRLLAPGGIVHLPNADAGGAEVLHELVHRYRSGLPDFAIQLTFALVHESWLVMRFSASGVHTGVLGIYPPTGNVLPSHGLIVASVDVNGEASEVWFHAGPAYALGFPDAGPGT